MLFDRLSHDWAELKERLSHLSALVVDDEELVRDLVAEILKAEGFDVECCGDAKTALERLRQKPYDLLVTDKNLPERSGLELIADMRAHGIDVPAAVITGYASIRSIAEAYGYGAADYIAKPFDDVGHVARRLKSIAERKVAERLYRQLIDGLKSAVAQSGADKKELDELGRELAGAKAALAQQVDVLVIDPQPTRGALQAEALEQLGLHVELAASPGEVMSAFEQRRAPLVAMVSLDLENPATFVFEVLAAEPLTEILVRRDGATLEAALAAVDAGATDFVDNSIESVEVLVGRVRRLVALGRSKHLHIHLIAALLRRLEARVPELAAKLVQSLPPEQLRYLAGLPVPERAETPLLDFGDELPAAAPPLDTEPLETRLSELGQNAAELVHEIRQPLLGIRAHAQLLAHSSELPVSLRERVKLILGYEQRIAAVLERTAASVRGETTTRPKVACKLNEVVESAQRLSLLTAPVNVHIDTELSRDLPDVVADPLALEQIVVNLLSNAKAALAERGGRIALRTQRADATHLDIVVHDDGPGVPAEARGRIFEPFVTTKASGTGLGLSLSKKLAEEAGGTLELMDAAHGAAFRLRLPLQ